METDSREPTMINRFWWLWLVAMITLIFGLWICMQSCHKNEMVDRINGAITKVELIIDTASIKAEDLATAGMESLDVAGQLFKSKWKALGQYLTIKLGEFYMTIPEKGVEFKLLNWLQDQTMKVDKTTWFNFDRILFEPGSAKLNTVSDEQIKNIGTIFNVMDTVEIKIGGYTDNTGDPAANKKLSLERAEAVKKALVIMGVDPKRIQTEGYGPEHPVADNNTEEGREQNRRVAIRVTKK